MTSDRLVADFTSDERRVLYDFVISKTKPIEDMKVEELHMIGDMKQDDKPRPKSRLELLIEQRDAKRRRISYKKKVHTNRKNQTEILREVIQNQMELLEQIIKEDCDDNNDNNEDDEVLSLGGAEENLLSYQNKVHSNKKNKCEDTGYIEMKKNCGQEVREQATTEHTSWHENNASCPEHNESRYARKKVHYELYSERSMYKRNGDNHERNEYNERREYKNYKMQSMSFDMKTRNRHNYYKHRGRSEGHRTHDRDGYHQFHKSRRHFEDFGEYSHSRQHRDQSNYDNPEPETRHKRKGHTHSRYSRDVSKSDSSKQNFNNEKEHPTQPKHLKFPIKQESPELDTECERNMIGITHEEKKSRNTGVDSSQTSGFCSALNDTCNDEVNRNNMYSKYHSFDSRTSKELCEDISQRKEHGTDSLIIKIKEEIDSDSSKHSKKPKKLKRKKKKRRHKSRKKSKKCHHSSASNSSSTSVSEESDSS